MLRILTTDDLDAVAAQHFYTAAVDNSLGIDLDL